jgi:peptidoglycan hydrolase CwlO-like protein
MRYKTLVTNKLEALDNSISRLNSLVSQNLTRDQFQEVLTSIKEKIQEIQTLINSEQESY